MVQECAKMRRDGRIMIRNIIDHGELLVEKTHYYHLNEHGGLRANDYK